MIASTPAKRVLKDGDLYFIRQDGPPPSCIRGDTPETQQRGCREYQYTGVYKNDGSHEPIWQLAEEYNVASDSYVSDDGQFLVLFNPFIRELGRPVMYFFKNGELQRVYFISELITYGDILFYVSSYIEWVREHSYISSTNRLVMKAINNGDVQFDMSTGEIVEHTIPKYFYHQGIVQLKNNTKVFLRQIFQCGGDFRHTFFEKEILEGYVPVGSSDAKHPIPKAANVAFEDIERISVIGRDGDSYRLRIERKGAGAVTFNVGDRNDHICGLDENNKKLSFSFKDVQWLGEFALSPRPPRPLKYFSSSVKPVPYKTIHFDGSHILQFSKNETKVFIHMSFDGGRTWSPTHMLSYGVHLNDAVIDPSRKNVWVIGSQGIILHSGDYGKTWSRQRSGTIANLEKIKLNSKGNMTIISGFRGPEVYSTDGGKSWKTQSSRDTH